MAITPRTGLDYRADGDLNWGPAHRNVRLMLDHLLALDNIYVVAKNLTPANIHLSGTPSNRRHFSTIQEAIYAWEDVGENAAGIILIAPGVYAERLVIRRSCSLISLHTDPADMTAVARGVYISGTSTVGPTVTVNPIAGSSIRVFFKNIQFLNLADDAGSEIDGSTPMILATVDLGAGNYGASRSLISFENCSFPAGWTYNKWYYGIRVRPHNRVTFRRCRFSWPGSDTGVTVRIPFVVQYNTETTRSGQLVIKDCEVNHPPYAAAPASSTVYKASGASGLVTRSTFNRDFLNGIYGHSGLSQDMIGLNGTESAAQYGNLIGINVTDQLAL